MKFNDSQIIAILGKAAQGKTHTHYQRCVDIASFYRSIFTGCGLEKLITSYRSRESDEQKIQRIAITKTRTAYIANRAFRPFDEVPRADNTIENITYYKEEKEKNDQKVTALYRYLNTFFEKKNAKSYLNQKFKHFQSIDPNAFLVVEISEDGTYSYPLEIYSEQAVDYSLHNGELQYLVCRHYKENTQSQLPNYKAVRYTFYAADVAVVIQSLPDEISSPELPEGFSQIKLQISEKKEQYFAYRKYNTGSKVCPAIRFGYIPDINTNLETYISPIESAREVFQELINAKSEYDLSLALHGYYKAFQYLPECDARDDKGSPCDKGKIKGVNCQSCNGTGLKVHGSSQDVISLPIPKYDDRNKESHVPMSDMMYYVPIPVELMEMQRQRVAQLEKDVALAIFNTNVLDRAEIAITATEKRIELNTLYNTLSEYGNRYSEIYKHIIEVTAAYFKLDANLMITHQFPRDFKMESLQELLMIRQSAELANVSSIIKDSIELSIMQKQNPDDLLLVQKYKVQQQLKPFRSLSETERIALLALLPDTNEDKILYLHFDKIMQQTEQEDILFYSKTPQAQQESIAVHIAKIASTTKTIQVL